MQVNGCSSHTYTKRIPHARFAAYGNKLNMSFMLPTTAWSCSALSSAAPTASLDREAEHDAFQSYANLRR